VRDHRVRKQVGAVLLGLVTTAFVLVPVAVAGAAGVRTAWFTNASYPTSNGGWIGQVTAGDLNGDGRQDVVVATDYAGGNVEVYYQNAQHTLDPSVVVDSAGSMLRVADINGDGRSDLVNFTSTGLSLRLQLVNGTLAPITTVSIPNAISGEVADYTGDGRQDVVVARSDNTVAVLAQLANGTLTAPIQIGTYPGLPGEVKLADLNNDLKLDVAVISGTNTIALRNQLPTGQLSGITTVTIPGNLRDFVLGDFNGDTKVDLATAHDFNGANYVVYRNADLTWGGAVGLTEPGDSTYYSMIRTADIDNDGKLDLVTIKSHTAAYVYFQGATGIGVQPLTVPHSVMQWPNIQNGWVADINGDGWQDILSAEYYGPLSVSLNTTGTTVSGIAGDVHNAASASLAGITVDAFDSAGTLTATTTTNGSGHYYFSWRVLDPDTAYTLRFTDPTTTYPTSWYAPGAAKPARQVASPVTYSLGSSSGADIVLPAATSVSGRLQNGHHANVAGLTVTLYAAGTSVALGNATTAANGTFAITKLLPGDYTASIADGTNTYESEWWGLPGRLKSGASGPTLPVTGPAATALGTHTIGAKACSTTTFAHGVSLAGQSLTGCWLKDVDLSAATLTGTDLAGSQLLVGNLSSANLTSADLTHASLFLANLASSVRTSVVYSDTTCPDGTNSDSHASTCTGHTANPIGSDTPVGQVIDVSSVGATDAIGWVVDPNTIDPISVRVTVDGLNPVDVVANLASSDASAAQPLYGANHGFDAALGTLPPGVHEVCVQALNVGPGTNVTLGCRVIDKAVTNTRYNAVQPTRLLDTRDGTGTGGNTAPLGAGASLDLKVTGAAGVPASHVGAVVLNVTATQPTASSFLTVWPTLTSRPLASNLNFPAGQTAPNLVVAKVGANGKISIFNDVGSVHVLADITGWFDDGTVGGGQFHPTNPVRVLDTRDGTGTGSPHVLGAGQVVHLQVAGNNGVGLGTSAAVVLNVTATQPTATSYLTVYPTGTTRPLASNLNVVAGQTSPNLVVAKVSADGWVDIYNASGNVQVIADLAGWFDNGTVSGTRYNPLPPARILDTRDGTGAGQQPLGTGSSIHLRITGRGGVPLGAQAVVLNVTATHPTMTSFLTVFPTGTTRPTASNLNVVAGQTVPNLVIVKVSPDGYVDIYNDTGSVDVIADVAGWFA